MAVQVDNSSERSVYLNFVSYNLHGYNQGSHTVRDLMLADKIDIFLLQEHWLTDAKQFNQI